MTSAVKKKIWRFPDPVELSSDILEMAGGSEILARLMVQRGFTEETAEAFLDPSKYTPTSPMAFADMSKAIVRITQAIGTQEKITVYGDYDVDGVTATSVMLTTLKKLGANVDFYIPNRATEGYGLNLKAVSILASKHRTKLIITCDCGISNFAEINLAKSLGVETIIVDHHSMPELLPPAVATLHPKHFAEDHPLFHLPGVGVAYKLAEALYLDNNLEAEIPKLHDYVTLGMIADMVPLVRENRYLVQIGLPALVNSERAGIRALLENTVKTDGTDIVGFGLAPRINAVGRLSDAGLAVKLMTVEDDATAQELAQQLEMENERRQELCEQIFFEADQKAKQALASGQDSALALYSSGWHHGVVGIVASRLVEKYHCPVFVAELDAEEGKIKGSARGVSGIDLYQILKANDQLMTKWGGHQMAAGFSAEAVNADALCRALVDTCNKALAGKSKRPLLEIDLAVEAEDVDLGLAKLLRKLGPFGMWNKKPVLAMQSLTVLNSRPLGKEGKHHRLTLRSPDQTMQFECVYWRSGVVPEDGTQIDLAFNPDVNVFNKSERLQLVLSDWRFSGEIVVEEEEDVIDFTPPAVPVSAAVPNVSEQTAAATAGVAPTALSSLTKGAGNTQATSGASLHLQTQYDGVSASSTVQEVANLPSGSADPGAAAVRSHLEGGAPRLDAGSEEIDMSPRTIQLDKEERKRITSESMQNLENNKDNNPELAVSVEDDSAQILSYDDDESGGLMSGGFEEDEVRPRSIAKQRAEKALAAGIIDTPAARTITQITWKDLRNHSAPESVVAAAARKLGSQVQLFGEACKLKEHLLVDRTALEAVPHLLIWQYPPSLQTFRSIISRTQASHVYLCGAGQTEEYTAAGFLKRLIAMCRYAANQLDGQAPAEKLCAGLASTKMALALGLTLLKKVDVIDWYAEDSMIFIEISSANPGGFEEHLEYRQLANTLKEITEFRNWCAEAPLDEIQSELVPNAIRLDGQNTGTSQEGPQNDTYSRANYNDRSHPSSQHRKG